MPSEWATTLECGRSVRRSRTAGSAGVEFLNEVVAGPGRSQVLMLHPSGKSGRAVSASTKLSMVSKAAVGATVKALPMDRHRYSCPQEVP